MSKDSTKYTPQVSNNLIFVYLFVFPAPTNTFSFYGNEFIALKSVSGHLEKYPPFSNVFSVRDNGLMAEDVIEGREDGKWSDADVEVEVSHNTHKNNIERSTVKVSYILTVC